MSDRSEVKFCFQGKVTSAPQFDSPAIETTSDGERASVDADELRQILMWTRRLEKHLLKTNRVAEADELRLLIDSTASSLAQAVRRADVAEENGEHKLHEVFVVMEEIPNEYGDALAAFSTEKSAQKYVATRVDKRRHDITHVRRISFDSYL